MMRYSINDLEKLSGIKAHTIRMWEKRYNIVTPSRTDSNIRYYNDYDLKRILNISTLNKHGFKISRIARMQENDVKEKIMEISGNNQDYESIINGLIVSMIELNEDTFEQILSNAAIKLGFEKTVTHALYPFLEKVGTLWQIGTINPAQEHFITYLIRQKLIIAIDGQAKTPAPGAKTFLLFLPENELHELGLLFYSFLLRKNGYRVIYLGQSVPFNDLLEVIRIRNTDYLLTYFVAALNQKDIPHYIRKISSALPGKKVIITGLQLSDPAMNLPDNVIHVKNAEAFKKVLSTL